MFKMTTFARLLALGASVAITFSVVALIADYGLPQDASPMLAQAGSTSTK